MIRPFAMAALIASLGVAGSAFAGSPSPFTPLTGSNPDTSASGEANNPFLLPAGFTQTLVTDRATLGFVGTTVGSTSTPLNNNWDMIAFDPTGQYVFIPFESQWASGLGRYDRNSGTFTQLALGNGNGVAESNPAAWNSNRALDGSDDFGAVDPAEWTPNGSVLWAEEWSGTGRIFETTNPLTADGTAAGTNNRWLSSIPSISHEGLKFDSQGTLYFVDEDNSGSIYKYVPTNAGDLSAGGQTFALKVDAYTGTASENFNSVSNSAATRTGAATWVAITDAAGVALTTADPFDYTSRGGRAAGDELSTTPYGRPEDLEIGVLADGTEVLYFATTSENIVYSVALDPNNDGIGFEAIVNQFVNANTTPDNIGNNPVTTDINDLEYGLGDPDNLAIGANGEIYILEDNNPGDIWVAFDADNDGVAESVSLWASLGQFGSEPTGMILDPTDPSGQTFLVAVQHPNSGNDALWSITVPEPTSLALLGLGGLLVARRRRA